MSIATYLAIYFLIWWITLFAVLPWGVRNQEETGEVVEGTDPGAPAIHRVWWKLLWTTLISGAIFGALLGAYVGGFIPFEWLAAISAPRR